MHCQWWKMKMVRFSVMQAVEGLAILGLGMWGIFFRPEVEDI